MIDRSLQTSMMCLLTVAGGVLGASCKATDSKATATPSTSTAASCPRVVTQLEEFLRALDWQDSFNIVNRQVELVSPDPSMATTWETAGDALQLQVSQNAIFMNGRAAQLEQVRSLPNRGSGAVYYLIDRDTTWARIQEVNRALLESNVRTAHLVFARKNDHTVDRPPMPEIDKLLESGNGNQAEVLAEYATKLLAPCPDVQTAFFEIPNTARAPAEADRMRKALVDGYRTCDCAVSFEKLRALFWLTLQDLDPVAFATVELDHVGGSTFSDGGLRWGDVYKPLVEMQTWHVE